MKHHFCTALAVLSLFYYGHSQSVYELSDRKNIVFARNLKDWLNQPVDSLMFDVYYPPGAMSNKKYPVYFSLHAGSFVTATKLSVTEISDEIAEYGFIVVAPDYRVGYDNNGGVSACIPGDDSTGLQGAIYRAEQDVNACVRYIANHGAEFNIDTSKIFIGGASAGGTLALNCAYVNDSLAAIHYPDLVSTWGKLQTTGNNEPFNYTIKGLAPMWGAMPAWDSLLNKKSAIPTILFKGGKDTNVPDSVGYYLNCEYNTRVRSGSGIYKVMIALGKPCVYHYQTYASHTAYDNDFCVKNIACFFNGLIANRPYSGYYELYQTSCH